MGASTQSDFALKRATCARYLCFSVSLPQAYQKNAIDIVVDNIRSERVRYQNPQNPSELSDALRHVNVNFVKIKMLN